MDLNQTNNNVFTVTPAIVRGMAFDR
jgi:hypothetical protein